MFHTGQALGNLGNSGDIEKHTNIEVYKGNWSGSEQFKGSFLYFFKQL